MPRHPPYTLKSLATFTDRRPPLDHPAPTHPENTPGEQEQQRPRQGVAGADDACRFVRMPQTAPLAGNLRDTRTSGRPVMGQLSPKKVLDDARPTESTVLERQTVGTAGPPRGGDHPGCRGGRRGSGQPPPARPCRAIAGRPDRTKELAFFLEPRLHLSKSNVPLGSASSASLCRMIDLATSSPRRKRRHRLSPVAPFNIKSIVGSGPPRPVARGVAPC